MSGKVCTFLLAFVALSSDFVVVCRPQRQRSQSGRGTNFVFTPAVRPSILFIRPIFDRQNRLIRDQEPVDEEVIFRERLSNNDDVVSVTTTTTAPTTNGNSRNSNSRNSNSRNSSSRNSNSRNSNSRNSNSRNSNSDSFRFPDDPVGFADSTSRNGSPPLPASGRGDNDDDVDRELPLPVFGHADILAVTKMLRSRDRNQAQFIKIGGANAGLLPLVNEDPSALNLFPPLRAAQKIPK